MSVILVTLYLDLPKHQNIALNDSHYLYLNPRLASKSSSCRNLLQSSHQNASFCLPTLHYPNEKQWESVGQGKDFWLNFVVIEMIRVNVSHIPIPIPWAPPWQRKSAMVHAPSLSSISETIKLILILVISPPK